ncbi:MAG: threonylcarbamoyl-AMP synthase [Clostridia bacterium]|nr:threonylcarbamoyl-AMP synthase [Clostridia bacterium]
MKTEILTLNTFSVQKAKDILFAGGVIGMPTETVYGLAGIGTMPNAVKKIFEVKGRPSDNPLIAHVHKDYDLNKLVFVEQEYAYKLIKAFMPGPLTLVFKSKGVVCKEATCGGETLAVRMPSHSGCQKLLKAVDMPIVAPSANLSKHTSPVTAEHVYNDLNGKIELILDGGKSSGGIESTVLDVTGSVPRILRAGLITKEMIEEVVGACEIAYHKDGDKVKSPGVKYTHYKPLCETMLFEQSQLDLVEIEYEKAIKQGKVPYVMCTDEVAEKFSDKNLLKLGLTPEQVASNLYDKLLEGEKKADLIIAVAMPDEMGVNMGVMNRLRKSCG